MRSISKYLVALSIGLVPLGCREPTPTTSDVAAVSNRPQQFDRFIAIIKLKSPALLDGAGDPATITREQDELIAKLSALSAEIQVIFRYRFVLNAVAVVAPKELEPRFRNMAEVAAIENDAPFPRPEFYPASPLPKDDLLEPFSPDRTDLPPPNASDVNSASWIGATRVRMQLTTEGRPINGSGTRVGIIDTGIDYTHSMFGGAGTEEAYRSVDPSQAPAMGFPNTKIVGGIDLVGSSYDSSSPKFDNHIPRPDNNPLDEGGHGTHVAGTIAGKGNGLNSYDGVAPDAQLYAIKVFGKNGSTGDAVILAGLEYAADPNQDLDARDRLDVINLSLGGDYGAPHALYGEAIRNLARAGTVSVIAAGNSGPNPFIVGAPSTSDAAISVAASIDNMPHNWTFPTVKFSTANQPQIVVEAVEATFSKPLSELIERSGKLVYLGLVDRDLSLDEQAAVNGNVALIDRGIVTFQEKISRAAQAGAVGVVVANNRDGAPAAMPGDDKVDIPAIMITQATGQLLKAALAAGDEARVDFKNPVLIERPELIDTIADFSSEGPRAFDGHIKPEVSAPGYQIWSAKMGGGHVTVALNGTSMAAPHVAGVAALLRQKYPTLPVSDIKSLVVNTAKPILDVNLQPYSIARTGVGRVQAFAAATTTLVFPEATVSLGKVLVETQKTLRRSVAIKNLGKETTLKIEWSPVNGLDLQGPQQITVPAGSTTSVTYDILIHAPTSDHPTQVLGTQLVFKDETGQAVGRVPVLAVAHRMARISAANLQIFSTSSADASGALAKIQLKNQGHTSGDAMAFNLLARDERFATEGPNATRPTVCDLQSAGYRLTKRVDNDGQTRELLQIGVKLYAPISNWHLCEISLLIDGNNDGIADQELLGTYEQSLNENPNDAQKFVSALTDAHRMRALRMEWELKHGGETPPTANYTDAMIDRQEFLVFSQSTLAVLTADITKLAKTPHGELRAKLATLPYDSSSSAGDDYLAGQHSAWSTIPLAASDQPFVDLPEKTTLTSGQELDLQFSAGGRRGALVVYFPNNASHFSHTQEDEQQRILKPKFMH